MKLQYSSPELEIVHFGEIDTLSASSITDGKGEDADPDWGCFTVGYGGF